MIPVRDRKASSIGGHSESTQGRDVSKAALSRVEKGTVPFPAAEGSPIANTLGQFSEGTEVVVALLIRSACFRCLRHDLSPVETSQVARVFLGDEAIGDKDILPAVVIQIDEERAPGPAPHGLSLIHI